jgi:hypothetical protein
VLYAVIIVLWICILLPMWLRRHDEALESRSVDRFSSAMRTLSGRSAGDRREVLMPARSSDPIHADGAARAVAEGRSVLAGRRRRTMGLLLALTLVVGGLGLLGVVPLWGVLLPVLLLTGFVVHLRRQTLAQASLDRRRRAQQTATESRRRRTAATTASTTARVEHILPAVHEEPVGVYAQAQMAEALHAAALAEVVTEVDLPYDSEIDRAWEPVPVPLPTYVTAPKAPRSVRVIDLTKPGLWTSGHLDPEEAERLVAEALARGADETGDVAAGTGPSATAVRHEPADGEGIVTGELVIERRRAVNG